MADRVIFAALPLVGTLVCTLTPSPPVSLNVNVGLSRHAPTPMRQPHQPFHALPNTPYHRRDDWCVRRPPPPPHTLPPTHHARRDNPSFYHCFSSSVFPHPLARLEQCYFGARSSEARFGVQSVIHARPTQLLPHHATFPTPPARGSTAFRPLRSHCTLDCFSRTRRIEGGQ